MNRILGCVSPRWLNIIRPWAFLSEPRGWMNDLVTISWRPRRWRRETTRTRSEGSSRRVNPFELEIRIHRFVEGVEAEGHSKIKMSTGGRLVARNSESASTGCAAIFDSWQSVTMALLLSRDDFVGKVDTWCF